MQTYTVSLYWSVMTFTTIGYGDIVPFTNIERIFDIVAMLIGALVFGYIIGAVGNVVQQVRQKTDCLLRRERRLLKSRCGSSCGFRPGRQSVWVRFETALSTPSSLQGEHSAGGRVSPHAQPGCPARGAPLAAARQLHSLTYFVGDAGGGF